MSAGSFYCKPQAEEFFADVGFYKQHEAYHLLKFHDERQIMRRAFVEYKSNGKSKNIYTGKEGLHNAQPIQMEASEVSRMQEEGAAGWPSCRRSYLLDSSRSNCKDVLLKKEI